MAQRYMAVLFNLQKLFVAPVAVWHIFTFYVISHSSNSWFEISNNLNLGFIAGKIGLIYIAITM